MERVWNTQFQFFLDLLVIIKTLANDKHVDGDFIHDVGEAWIWLVVGERPVPHLSSSGPRLLCDICVVEIVFGPHINDGDGGQERNAWLIISGTHCGTQRRRPVFLGCQFLPNHSPSDVKDTMV